MQFGLGIPTCREGRTYPCGFADPLQIAALARNAEHLGFDSLWANDHLATQRAVLAEQSDPANFYEPMITFAYLSRCCKVRATRQPRWRWENGYKRSRLTCANFHAPT